MHRNALSALAALATAASLPAFAKTVTTGPTDSAGLQAIVDQAGVDRVRLKPGNYHLGAPVVIRRGVSIEGQKTGASRPHLAADGIAFAIPDGVNVSAVAFKDLVVDAGLYAVLAIPGLSFDVQNCSLSTGALGSLQVTGSKLSGAGVGVVIGWGDIGSVDISGNDITVTNGTVDGNLIGSGAGVVLNSSLQSCSFASDKIGRGVRDAHITGNSFHSTTGVGDLTVGALSIVVPGVEIADNFADVNGVGFIDVGLNADDVNNGTGLLTPLVSHVSGNTVSGAGVGTVAVGRVVVDRNSFSVQGAGVVGGSASAVTNNKVQAIPAAPGFDVGPSVGIGVDQYCLFMSCLDAHQSVVSGNTISGFPTGISAGDRDVTRNAISLPAAPAGADPSSLAVQGLISHSQQADVLIAENLIGADDNAGGSLGGVDVESQAGATVRANYVGLGRNAGPATQGMLVQTLGATVVEDNTVWLRSASQGVAAMGLAGAGQSFSLRHNLVEGPFQFSIGIATLDPTTGAMAKATENFVHGAFLIGIDTVSSVVTGNTLDLTADPTGTAQGIVAQDVDGYPSVIANNHFLGLLAPKSGQPHGPRWHASPLSRARTAWERFGRSFAAPHLR